jgi:ornithine cyclodeaminase/alanine dehydrogenase-like protein (mu-crystallin family)
VEAFWLFPEAPARMVDYITYEAMVGRLSWPDAVKALAQGHRQPKAHVGDLFLGPTQATLLNRAAYVEALGYGVKAVTVFEGNASRGLPSIQGAMFLFSAKDGQLESILDSRLVTEWKTAADSVLGATLLARPESRHLLLVGAGIVAGTLVKAYSECLPQIEQISVWARRAEQADAFAAEWRDRGFPVEAAPDLPAAVAAADIVSTATMAREPVLKGDWVWPGTHVDLIGAFKADMREADDTLVSKGRFFVDCRETTIGHIGELMIPIRDGILSETAILGDLYDLVGSPGRRHAEEITVFKNGGGAHLDLMTARYIASVRATMR